MKRPDYQRFAPYAQLLKEKDKEYEQRIWNEAGIPVFHLRMDHEGKLNYAEFLVLWDWLIDNLDDAYADVLYDREPDLDHIIAISIEVFDG